MSGDEIITPEGEREKREAMKHALLAGPWRALELETRLPALFRSRGWPEDADLLAVCGAALALVKIKAGGTVIRRPDAAERCSDCWPVHHERLTASAVVARMDLGELLNYCVGDL